ncbi:1,4-dihydroxy-2-naphthoate octaprenyltransferase [Brumimicrobium salinarum]|uniref:1,4-dihydroxy-2-naphthoate octaprenyltransferase n=1 Tax=Brumimicrobium salinarum TaxID=2058658 RepID=A0A2I0R0G3_9FLAO|nr:1,4-dihydroxy-2-naphthoate octaprenyltransferase [Brumimicrobium salinarum]PKR80049.1 1,4-dihydroxy-2-naphthoate octaprenyltransferase [Brumimicrobium salinarum]
MEIKSWIHAARLRTLPLSISGIIVGSFVAYKQGFWDTTIFSLSMLTTLFLQILSNFANDLGDSFKGADNESRVGPIRAVQSGKITQKQMIVGTVIMSLLSLATAIPLIILGTDGMPTSVLWVYVILALLSVLAAITYTVGKKAYGYNGMGDVMVFIFFGLVSVLGVYSLYAKQFDWSLLGMAFGIGLLSIAVLNLNNMRDHENDKLVNKRTIVVSMGFEKSKIYHTVIIITSFIGILSFIIYNKWWWSLIALTPYLILIKHLSKVWQTTIPKTLDPELKKVALSTFAISILFLISTLL